MNRFIQTLVKLGSVFNIKPLKLKLDLGSLYTRVSSNGRLVYHQPSCLVYATDQISSQTVLCLGDKALAIRGKTPPQANLSFPFQAGQIGELDLAQLYLASLFKQVLKKESGLLWPIQVECALPSSTTKVQKKFLQKILRQAGASSIEFRPKASLYTAALNQARNSGLALLDIGAATTELVLYYQGQPVFSQTLEFGGEQFTALIAKLIKQNYQLEISWQTAEKLKQSLPDLLTGKSVKLKSTVRGRDLIENTVQTKNIDCASLSLGFKRLANKLASLVKYALTDVGTEQVVASWQTGLYLTGGASQLPGLDKFLSEEFKTQVIQAKRPYLDLMV